MTDSATPLVQFTVFHQGGLVLFNHENYRGDVKPKKNPINELIQEVLLHPEGSAQYLTERFAFRWSIDNALDLVFVCIYFAELRKKYDWVNEFLTQVKKLFINHFDDLIKTKQWASITEKQYKAFEWAYVECVRKCSKPKSTSTQPRKFAQTGKAIKMAAFGREDLKVKEKEDEAPKKDPKAKLVPRKGPSGFRGRKGKKGKDKETKPKKKAKREWSGHMAKKNVDKKDMDANTIKSKAQLERERMAPEKDNDTEVEEYDYYDPTAEANFEETDSEDDFEEEDESPATSRLWSAFQSITGTRPLSAEDLTPALETMRNHLIEKNTAVDIADAVCATVGEQLEGQTCGTFNTIHRKVKEAMKMVLTRVLNPVSRRNVLTEIARAKRAGRPYSIAFVGVNGVGKSTSLAKIGYYLKRHNLKVSVCACDTFRSGAVEQLNTHGEALKIRVFNQGYNKDPSEVAYRGLKKAFQEKDDVVLIDTAGRMQGKVHLMRELAKLIQRNSPDLVLFVGEALVGNDGVDQLVHFNKALEDHSQSANPRLIDGIVLTKFDTVDDKVGAAISMCHVSQKPIMFVGIGQNYPDMKRLNVSTLLAKLLR